MLSFIYRKTTNPPKKNLGGGRRKARVKVVTQNGIEKPSMHEWWKRREGTDLERGKETE